MEKHTFFHDLNYTLANEDTQVESQLLTTDNLDSIFCIAGSGGRVLPLLAKNPKHLTIVDMSLPQLYLVELRIQAAKSLSYEEYLYFMGYRGAIQGAVISVSRKELFLKLKLGKDCAGYWSASEAGWNSKGFIYLGKWESHFSKISYIFREYLKCDFEAIFESETLEDQISAYERTWPKVRLNSFLRVFASEWVFNRYIYKGHFSGGKDRSTENKAPWEFLLGEFDRVFRTQLVRKNFFFQWLFLGKIRYEEGLPLEAHRETIEGVKNSTSKINFIQNNLVDVIKRTEFSFYSLSDTISYLDSETANQILQLLPNEKFPKKTVVIRSFMRAPQELNLKGFVRLIEAEKTAHLIDGTSVYRFHIFNGI